MTTNAIPPASQTDRLATLRERLDQVPPITGFAREKLDRAYDVDLTCASTALSGSALTLREVGIVVEKGEAIGGKRLIDHLMVIDHDDAVQAMRRLAAEQRALTEADLLDLHRLILRRCAPDLAGRYADRPAVYAPAKQALTDVVQWFADQRGYEAAFEAHSRLIAARLFRDGNGRLARLVMNLMLLRDGWPLLPIWPAHATEYRHVVAPLRDALPAAPTATRAARHRFLRARLIDACEAYLRVVEPEMINE